MTPVDPSPTELTCWRVAGFLVPFVIQTGWVCAFEQSRTNHAAALPLSLLFSVAVGLGCLRAGGSKGKDLLYFILVYVPVYLFLVVLGSVFVACDVYKDCF